MSGIFAWLAAVSVAALVPGSAGVRQISCFPETRDHIALYRSFLQWPNYRGASYFDSDIFGVVDTSPSGFQYVGHVSVALSNGNKCVVAYERIYKGDSARTRADKLGNEAMVDVIVENHGGSGNSFNHYLLANVRSGLHEVASPDFSHSNMGGFYLGDLGASRGLGAVVWDAIWDDGAHYDPHRYSFTFYKWTGSAFAKPEKFETSTKITPEPDLAAKAAGFSFRDETGQEVMPITYLTSVNNSGD